MSDYLSVSEYSERYGKDPGNIRRLLSCGRLEGKKVGKQWIIPADAVYPEDKRGKSGKFRNQRKKAELMQHRELMASVSDMIVGLRSVYGELMTEVIIYGSYARGTQTEESDVDIAVFIRGKAPKETTDAMIECVSAYELECGKTLSVIEIDCRMYSLWKDTVPFYRNINKEGIVLWKAET